LPETRWLTVVGVTGNAKEDDWAAAPRNEIYLPYLQAANYLTGTASRYAYLTLVIRSNGKPASLTPAVEHAIGAR